MLSRRRGLLLLIMGHRFWTWGLFFFSLHPPPPLYNMCIIFSFSVSFFWLSHIFSLYFSHPHVVTVVSNSESKNVYIVQPWYCNGTCGVEQRVKESVCVWGRHRERWVDCMALLSVIVDPSFVSRALPFTAVGAACGCWHWWAPISLSLSNAPYSHIIKLCIHTVESLYRLYRYSL